MNILIATNSKFLEPAVTMLYSLFTQHPDTEMDIYLPYHDLKPDEVESLMNYMDAFTAKRLHPFDVGAEFSKRVKAFGHFSVEIFYRILAIDMLPKDIDRILYLDADIIVKGDLTALYNSNIEGHPFTVCEDISAKINDMDKKIKDNIGMPHETPYFNSGVMLFNLDYLRDTKASKRMLKEIYDKYDKYPYPDQDVMNMMFADELLYAGWDIYNCPPCAYFLDLMAAEQGSLKFATYAEVRKASKHPESFAKRYMNITAAIRDNAHIIHYIGEDKPWLEGAHNSSIYYRMFGDLYRKYHEQAGLIFHRTLPIRQSEV